jgi:ElaB/YqjD/DUF883 family membrane-anchored ribosome-binding protein
LAVVRPPVFACAIIDSRSVVMSSEELQGKVQSGLGKVETAAGQALDDPSLQAKGEVRQFSGRVQEAVGRARETMGTAASRARAAFDSAPSQASDAYQALRDNAQMVAGRVDPFVKEQPYVAVVAGVVIGLLAGALLFSGGSKVIYVKPQA